MPLLIGRRTVEGMAQGKEKAGAMPGMRTFPAHAKSMGREVLDVKTPVRQTNSTETGPAWPGRDDGDA
jgi:hypothetical protein